MAQALLSAYFFPGPEIGSKRERINAIRERLTKMDGQEPEFHRFYPYDTQVAEIVSLMRNGSLFSVRRLVVVADAHALKAADLKILIEYLRSPSPETLLIFTTDHAPGSREYPRSIADTLPKGGVEVFWEMFDRDKRGWVMRFFREKGIGADNNAVDLLIDLSEGTTDALKEACERLCFSVGPSGTIGENDVDKALEHSRDETVYTLFDRFCRRNLAGVLDAYRKMIHSDPGTVDRILTMLSDPLTRLREFKVRVSRGVPEDAAAREVKLRGGKRGLRAYSDGARRYSEDELDAAVSRLIELEAWLRTAPRELRAPKTEIWFCTVIGP